MATQSKRTDEYKRILAKTLAEEAAWVRHCNGFHERMTANLGRTPHDGEWLDCWNGLVDRWQENKNYNQT